MIQKISCKGKPWLHLYRENNSCHLSNNKIYCLLYSDCDSKVCTREYHRWGE